MFTIKINEDHLRVAIKNQIAVFRRACNKPGINPGIKMIYEKDIAEYEKALASISPYTK